MGDLEEHNNRTYRNDYNERNYDLYVRQRDHNERYRDESVPRSRQNKDDTTRKIKVEPPIFNSTHDPKIFND